MPEMISVSEAAQRLSVSRYRIYARLRDGSIRGRQSGRSWLVDSSSLPSPRRTRPMSADMALALVLLFDNVQPEGLLGSEMSRLRAKGDLLSAAPADELIERVRSWMAARAPIARVQVAPADLEALREDNRLVPSGLSDPRADMAAADVVEGYIARADLDDFADDHFIDLEAEHQRPNLVLRTLKTPPAPIPRLLSAADLIDHGGPRETQAALRLLERA